MKDIEYTLSFAENNDGGIITFYENGDKYYTNNELGECWNNIQKQAILVTEEEVPQIKK